MALSLFVLCFFIFCMLSVASGVVTRGSLLKLLLYLYFYYYVIQRSHAIWLVAPLGPFSFTSLRRFLKSCHTGPQESRLKIIIAQSVDRGQRLQRIDGHTESDEIDGVHRGWKSSVSCTAHGCIPLHSWTKAREPSSSTTFRSRV